MNKLRYIGTIVLGFSINLPAFAASIATIDIKIKNDGQTKTKTEIVTIDGDKARLDFLGAVNKKTDQTPYLLTIDGGKSWVLGNTLKGKFFCANVDPVDFFKRIGVIVNEVVALVNPKVLDIKVRKDMEQPGPKILDYPSTHVRLITTANAQATIMFKKYEYAIKITDDIWYTKQLEIQPFRKRWFEAITQSGYQKLDQMFADWAKELSGPILKLESKIELTDLLNKKTDIQTEMAQITSIKEVASAEIPKHTFAIHKCEDINQKQLEATAKDLAKEGKIGL